MPAGLGVWIANEKCLEKAVSLKEKGLSIGAHHDLPTLWKNAKNYQNPSTPNVMGIFLLGKIAEDMNKTGIDTIRKTNASNAKKIYQHFENKEGYEIFVKDPDLRSKTVAVINTSSPSSHLIQKLKAENMIIGSGYGPGKDNQIRIANFISTSTEDIEALLEKI